MWTFSHQQKNITHTLLPTVFYRGQKMFFENGTTVFETKSKTHKQNRNWLRINGGASYVKKVLVISKDLQLPNLLNGTGRTVHVHKENLIFTGQDNKYQKLQLPRIISGPKSTMLVVALSKGLYERNHQAQINSNSIWYWKLFSPLATPPLRNDHLYSNASIAW